MADDKDWLTDSFDLGDTPDQVENPLVAPKVKKNQAFYSEIGRKGGKARAKNAKKRSKARK